MANGTLKVSNIQTSSGSGTITIGQSGETITIPSGIMSGQNYPAFAADRQASVTDFFSDNVITKVTFDVEQVDTDSAFDLSNNKFIFWISSFLLLARITSFSFWNSHSSCDFQNC